jgi:hypothetical protein
MKLDAGEIEQLVEETERKRASWAKAADVWENDWYGARYNDSRQDHREIDGIEAIVTPDAFNIVQLLLRFVAGEQRVEVPSLSVKEDDEDRSEIMEEWLVAFDQESNRQQGRNHINDMTLQSGVLARGATQVMWVGDLHKKQKITNRLPILRITRDPRNVGIGRGAFGINYGYHKYNASRNYIEEMYPKYKLPDLNKNHRVVQGFLNENHKIIDYYYRHSGSIWHGVVIDGKFGKDPVQTDYPEIPIIEHYADGAPFDDELGRSLSILHPVHELIKMKSDVMSKVATGLMYHYDPLMIATNFGPNDKVTAGPGEVIYLRDNQKLDMFRPEPNVPMAQALLSMIQTGIDQATFPGVTYGDAPGGVNAGFALQSLSQQARSRVNVIRQNIESAMEAVNQQILGLIEAFVPDEGVEVYGRSARGDRGKPLKLDSKTIKGNYANQVTLMPESPMDDVAKLTAYSHLIEKGVISKTFFQNRIMNIPVPRDEELRIAFEQSLQMPEIQQKHTLRAIQKSMAQDDWELLIQGTPLQQVHEQEVAWQKQKKAEAEQAKQARQLEKQQKEMMEAMANMPPPPMGMPPGLPPMPPPGMPPMPPGGMGMPPEMGLPPAMPGMPPPGNIQPPGLPGVPPQMAGQLSPDQLGIPPGAPPGMFDQMMGGPPPSEEDLLRGMLGGGAPPMI